MSRYEPDGAAAPMRHYSGKSPFPPVQQRIRLQRPSPKLLPTEPRSFPFDRRSLDFGSGNRTCSLVANTTGLLSAIKTVICRWLVFPDRRHSPVIWKQLCNFGTVWTFTLAEHFDWLRGLDSNQDNQIQSLVCYRLHHPGVAKRQAKVQPG